MLIPPTVFCVSGAVAGLPIDETLRACAEQYVARRQNLLIVSVLGLLPIAVLAIGLWAYSRWRSAARLPEFAFAGLLPILVVLTWANLEFWPDFLPDRVYPGFPHGLELVLGPLFYAPVAMLIGLAVARLALSRDA